MRRPLATLRRRLAAGASILVFFAVILLGWRGYGTHDGAPDLADRAPALRAAALTVAPGIHMLGDLAPAAAYAVETANGLVLIDSGLDANAALVKKDLGALGLDWHNVRAILLTHAHGDHSLGAACLRSATGAKVYAGRADAAVLRAGTCSDAFFGTFVVPGASLHPTPVDVQLDGGEMVSVGGVEFQVLACPGHTPGSVCYLTTHGGRRVLFGGDVIVSLVGDPGLPAKLATPLGTYAAYAAPHYRGSASSYLATLRMLRSMPSPDLVLPGHPRMDHQPQSPTMSQPRWEALLDRGIREMEQLLARQERDGVNFLDGTPRKLATDIYYLGEADGAAAYAFGVASRWFLVGLPRGPGFHEFAVASLRKLGVTPVEPTALLLPSAEAEDVAGLRDFCAQSRAAIVVAAAGLERVRAACPAGTELVPAQQLGGRGWFPVKALALAGPGIGPAAYQVTLHSKEVLFTGRIPTANSEAAGIRLQRDCGADRGKIPAFLASLKQLDGTLPDVWLPAATADRQCANLYDRDWDDILNHNRKLLEELLH